LKFGLSKWEGSQNFSLFGVARRAGEGWVFSQSDPEYVYNEENQDWDYVGTGQSAQLTCQVSIAWDDLRNISLAVDERASCPGHAGYGFAEKSSRFTAGDFLGKVTFELDDSDTFSSARTAEGC
jgi:hypothetical protein